MYWFRFRQGRLQRVQSFSKSSDNSLQTLLKGETIHSYLHKNYQPQLCSYRDPVHALRCRWMECVHVCIRALGILSLYLRLSLQDFSQMNLHNQGTWEGV